MTYRIEIRAETLSELAGKAYAFAVGVQSASSVKSEEVVREVAEAAPVNPTPAPKSAPAAETSESPQTTEEPSTTAAPATSASELDFDTDVAPLVLRVVKDKGKPVVQQILEQFGVERASLLDASRWPELVAALQDAL